MDWLISLGAAALSAVAGLFLAGFIAHACVSWYRISSREGASGYFVIYLALIGAVTSGFVGLVGARMVASRFGPGFGRELAGALAAVSLIAAVVAGVCRLLADVAPTIDGRDLNLEVEFRLPDTHRADRPPSHRNEWRIRLAALSGHTQRTYRDGEVRAEAARYEDGRWTVPAEGYVFTERGRRVISLECEGKDEGGFVLPLPGRPGREFLSWSDWLPRQQASGQPWPEDKLSYRFRVQKTIPPPPPKSEAEVKAVRDAEEAARFAAVPLDAPVQTWFPYLAYEQPLTQRALQVLSGRATLASELGALVVDEDPKLAHDALCCIGLLPAPSNELIGAVQAAGREIGVRITRFNQTPSDRDPSFETAVDPARRFYGWMRAVQNLRERCGGDFTPELKTILELSRVRPESHCMRQDICRVASFYLNQWAGIPPLPTDPAPN
jgi:hypothetical protein